jgi:IMP and pyridine-specific 5'-nucleotidase
MIDMMISLMQRGIHVAVVTAAGYPGEPLLFEARIRGLLDAFKARGLPQDVTNRFLMLGGECNYLLRYSAQFVCKWHTCCTCSHRKACRCRYEVPAAQLQFVPDEMWKSKQMRSWTKKDIELVLDSAQALLVDCASSLRVPVSVCCT